MASLMTAHLNQLALLRYSVCLARLLAEPEQPGRPVLGTDGVGSVTVP